LENNELLITKKISSKLVMDKMEIKYQPIGGEFMGGEKIAIDDSWKIIVIEYVLKSQYPRGTAKRLMTEALRDNINSRPAFKDVTAFEISDEIDRALLVHPERPVSNE
jgi:hypothetical protein